MTFYYHRVSNHLENAWNFMVDVNYAGFDTLTVVSCTG